ncbi:carbon-nitrogen hydrolase family protein [Mycobacterium sp. NPDC003449]
MGQPAIRHTVEDNVAAAAELVGTAQARGAGLVLLPELCLSGYRPEAIGAQPERWAVTLDDPRLQPLRRAVQTTGVAVALGAALRGTTELYNATLWFRTDGTVEHVYSKVHLWTAERPVFTAGDRQAVVACHGLRFGIGICYDAGFPEFVRSYARAGVDAVLFSSAFAVGAERYRYDIYHQSRALENGVHIAVSNSTGTIGTVEFFGHSQVFDRQGRCQLDVETTDRLGVTELGTGRYDGELVPYLEHLRPIHSDPDHFEG